VRVIYKSIPDSDPMTEMLLRSILQAMDEWHSLNSKAKGLAGMAENVRQGFRAGGRAPRGYRLEYTSTGAIRDGSPVLKSKLVLGDDAHQVAQYLYARATGEPRGRVLSRLRLKWPVTSLVGMEWQALTYAWAYRMGYPQRAQRRCLQHGHQAKTPEGLAGHAIHA